MFKLDDKHGHEVGYQDPLPAPTWTEDHTGTRDHRWSRVCSLGQKLLRIKSLIMDVLKSIAYPDELMAIVKFKLGGCNTVQPKHDLATMSADKKTCYDFLNKTSRSFAAVIQALDGELRDAVCIFYLVLRALDTVEDDMTISLKEKVPMLKVFYTHLQDPAWTYHQSQEKDRIVLEKFTAISAEFRRLSPMYQEVISDICRKMGEGMTKYLDQSPDTLDDWDEYCHYVAGLVGIGLSQLFSASGLEAAQVGEDTRLSNSMGLFLQKTNIIRDYLEDVVQGRLFWPKEVWSMYGDKLEDLARPDKLDDALSCLNHLVTNALQHVPDVITYMSRIKNQSVFNFCAIPQVMAIATLERCYNNPAVFRGVVKIRKGEAVRMMMEATDLDSVKSILNHFTKQIESRVPQDSNLTARTRMAVQRALNVTQTEKTYVTSLRFPPLYVSATMLVSAIVWNYWTSISGFVDGLYT